MKANEERNEAIFSFNESFGLGKLAVSYFRRTKDLIDPNFYSPRNDFIDMNMEFSYTEGEFQGVEWYHHPNELNRILGSMDKYDEKHEMAQKYADLPIRIKETDFLFKIDLERAVDLNKTLDFVYSLVRNKQREYGLIHSGNGSKKNSNNYDKLYWTGIELELGLKCFDLKLSGKSNVEIKKELFPESETDANKTDRYIKNIMSFINDPFSLPPANHSLS